MDSYYDGEFNYDGTVNGDDYFLIDSAFLAQNGVLSAEAMARMVAVPEPGALGLLAFAGMLSMRRRRH